MTMYGCLISGEWSVGTLDRYNIDMSTCLHTTEKTITLDGTTVTAVHWYRQLLQVLVQIQHYCRKWEQGRYGWAGVSLDTTTCGSVSFKHFHEGAKTES